eukprot:m.14530 g.14530  ORF g.14530 m.14530 type:complete len:442 (+) comp25805_c0_seq1:594-1919(+)
MDDSRRRRPDAASYDSEAIRRGDKGVKHTRKSRGRKRRESTKSRVAAVRKTLNVEVYYGGDSSGYGSSVSVSGDELSERTRSGVPRLPPIASSPPLSPALTKTPDIRTRTASPLTPLPLTPLSPPKLSPAPSGKFRNRRSLLSLSTATSSTDSAFDSSATSSRTSVKGHVLDYHSATRRCSAHLEPPQASWSSRNKKPGRLSPISNGRPALKNNLYLTDTNSNLTGREMYIQFSIPRLQPLSSPVGIATQPGHLVKMGAQPQPPPPPQQQHQHQQQRRKIEAPSPHTTSGSWPLPNPMQQTGRPNLVLIGGSPSTGVARSLEAMKKTPLPAIRTPDPSPSSSNLHVCRSSEGSAAAVSVIVDPTGEESDRDQHGPLPQFSRKYPAPSLSLCSSGSSTPTTSSLLDLTRCVDGLIPSINLIAPTPLPPGQSRPPSRTSSRVA